MARKAQPRKVTSVTRGKRSGLLFGTTARYNRRRSSPGFGQRLGSGFISGRPAGRGRRRK